jgi:hypothetical protein
VDPSFRARRLGNGLRVQRGVRGEELARASNRRLGQSRSSAMLAAGSRSAIWLIAYL